jgi:hypothetical protein
VLAACLMGLDDPIQRASGHERLIGQSDYRSLYVIEGSQLRDRDAPRRSDAALPRWIVSDNTGRDCRSSLTRSEWAPITTTIGRQTDATAVSTACRRRVRSRKGNSCLGCLILREPPATRMTVPTDLDVRAYR